MSSTSVWNVFTLYLVLLVWKLADDRMALVSGISLDPEAAIGVTKKLPPKWVDGVDEVRTGNVDSVESGLSIILVFSKLMKCVRWCKWESHHSLLLTEPMVAYYCIFSSDSIRNHTGSAEDEGSCTPPRQAHEPPHAGWQHGGGARHRNHHTGDHTGRPSFIPEMAQQEALNSNND